MSVIHHISSACVPMHEQQGLFIQRIYLLFLPIVV